LSPALFGCGVLAACVAIVRLGAATSELVEREAYLMGTRAKLATFAPTRQAGLEALENALRALEQTERELSTWRTDSDIARLNRHPVGEPWVASDSLCRTFADLFHWHERTGGAFDPAIGQLLTAWDVHGGGRVPTPVNVRRALDDSGLQLLAFDRDRCTLTRKRNVRLDTGAFGKGDGLDRAAAVLGPSPWLIDLGGQISVGGDPPAGQVWNVAIAHPVDRHRPYLHVHLSEGSLATSGGSERDRVVAGKRVGHILDPLTGEPAPFNGSVTVWHARGLAADALSTAMYVMGPERGLRWAEETQTAVCYLIPEHGGVRIAASTRFRTLMADPR
jgi:thiamine biosynthesis lipoprotein